MKGVSEEASARSKHSIAERCGASEQRKQGERTNIASDRVACLKTRLSVTNRMCKKFGTFLEKHVKAIL